MLIVILLIVYGLLLSYLLGYQLWAMLQKLTGNTANISWYPALYALVGMASMSWFLGVYHLFFAIDYIPHLFFIGWLAASYKQNLQLLKGLLVRPKILPFALVLLSACLAVMGRPGTGDIADYHLQGIKWAEAFANIPGLGNFNRPLANNNWWFNLQAFFGCAWLGVKSVYVGNAIYFICVFFWFCFSEPLGKAHQWMRAILMVFIVLSLKTAFIGAVTPDIVVTFTLFLLLDLFMILKAKPERLQSGLWLMFILLSWVLSVKATALSFGMLAIPFLYKLLKEKQFAFVAKLMIPVLLIMVPWLVGNVLVSGYLLYPFHQLDFFDVSWKLPADLLKWETFSIKNWGKVPNQDVYLTAQMSVGEWLPVWFSKLDVLNKSLVLLFAISTPIVWVLGLKRKEVLWPALFVLAGFVLFFMNGPHPRFLFGYMVAGIALLAYLLADKIPLSLPPFALPLVAVLSAYLVFANYQKHAFTDALIHPMPYPDCRAQLTPIDINSFKAYETKTGSTCWDCFPCTYYKSDSLKLRGERVEKGFAVISSEF